MDIQKIFNELGRMHLEIMQLKEDLALAQAKLAQYSVANNSKALESNKTE